MEIPGLGTLAEDHDSGWLVSYPVPVAVLGGKACVFIVDGYEDDPAPEDFHAAIRRFLALDGSALTDAAPAIFAYYRAVTQTLQRAGVTEGLVRIAGPGDVLDHVRLGTEPTVLRDPDGDRRVYVSLECECAWEPEHGLHLAFRNGATITRAGPYDGHLTDA